MQLSVFKKTSNDDKIKLLLANKGKYVYYVEFTEELRLSTKNFGDGSLILSMDGHELNLGPIKYIGEL